VVESIQPVSAEPRRRSRALRRLEHRHGTIGSWTDDEPIAAQIAYDRARARNTTMPRHAADHELWPEYVERLRADVAELDAWLASDPPNGHVLEIAAGSGNRTDRLLRSADRVTAVDAAREMLDLLAAKYPEVERIEADIFAWEPPQQYDNIFFGYWITHIPAGRRAAFWDLVDRALAPGRRVWFMDNAHPDHANACRPGDRPEVAAERRIEEAGTQNVARRRTPLTG